MPDSLPPRAERIAAICARVALLDELGLHADDGPYVHSEAFTLIFDDIPWLLEQINV